MIKNLLTAAAIALLTAGSAFAQQTVFIGETGYSDIAAAYAAATDGDVITVKGNQTKNLSQSKAKAATFLSCVPTAIRVALFS